MSGRAVARAVKCSTRGLLRVGLSRNVFCAQRIVQSRAAAPSFSSKRLYATPPPQVNVSDTLTAEQYHTYSDATMETLLDSLENLLDSNGNPEYEVEYSSGVLTLKLGEHGTYVINKQPPNKQIWLSSPTSGPKRYDYVPEEDEWIYSRDKQPLGHLLNDELSKIFGQDIDLGIHKVSDALDWVGS